MEKSIEYEVPPIEDLGSEPDVAHSHETAVEAMSNYFLRLAGDGRTLLMDRIQAIGLEEDMGINKVSGTELESLLELLKVAEIET